MVVIARKDVHVDNIKKKKYLKIFVPVIILILIVGVWMLKNLVLDKNEDYKSDALVTPMEEAHFELDAKTLDLQELTQYGLPIVLDFGSDSCLPCISFHPTLKNMHKDMYGRVIIKYIDVYKYGEAVQGFPVSVLPTQIFINADGTPYVPSKNVNIPFAVYNYNTKGEHAYTAHEGVLTKNQFLEILEDMGVSQ